MNQAPATARPATVERYDRSMVLHGHTRPTWTFFTNHAHVLIAISRDPELRQRDIAQLVGITEGAVQRILHDLESGGYLRRERVGRRNRYHVTADQPLRHPLESDRSVDDILRTLNEPIAADRAAS